MAGEGKEEVGPRARVLGPRAIFAPLCCLLGLLDPLGDTARATRSRRAVALTTHPPPRRPQTTPRPAARSARSEPDVSPRPPPAPAGAAPSGRRGPTSTRRGR